MDKVTAPTTEELAISIKDYEAHCFSIDLFKITGTNGKFLETEDVTKVFINDDTSIEITPEIRALSTALEKLVEKHGKELIELYKKELKEIEEY